MVDNNFSQTIVIFGATSAVAQALAKLHAQAGDAILLVARNSARLESIANDLKVRGAQSVDCIVSDLVQTDQHTELLGNIAALGNDISRYYFFYGVLPDQSECESS